MMTADIDLTATGLVGGDSWGFGSAFQLLQSRIDLVGNKAGSTQPPGNSNSLARSEFQPQIQSQQSSKLKPIATPLTTPQNSGEVAHG